MCVTAWNREKFTKTPILGVQGRSMSSMLVPLVSTCYDTQQVCVYLQPFSRYRRANSSKLRFLRGYPFLMPSFDGNLLTQRQQIISLETRDPSYHMVKARSLYLTWAWFGNGACHPRRTDRQTDGQNSHSWYALSAVPAGTAVARKNEAYRDLKNK